MRRKKQGSRDINFSYFALAFAFIFLLFLCSQVSAEGCGDNICVASQRENITTCPQDCSPAGAALELSLPSWFPLLAAALAIGYGLAALFFMASSVFKLPELGVWARSEVTEVTMSAVLAVVIIIIAEFSDAIFIAAAGSTPMQISTDFLNSLSDKSISLFIENVNINWMMSILSSVPPQYNIAAGGGRMGAAGLQLPIMFMALSLINVSFYDYTGASVFLGHFGLLQSSTLAAAGLAIIMRVALDFIKAVALPVMVPLGIFLSIFVLTRKMGRTLIAIGICLYFFFPASVYMSKMMYDSAFHPGTDPPEMQSPASVQEFNKFAENQLIAKAYSIGSGSLILAPLIVGSVPAQLLCIPEAAVVAAPCTVLFPVCYAAYFIPCVRLVKPLVVWPLLTFISYEAYTANNVLAHYSTIADETSPEAAEIIKDTAWVPGVSGIGSFTASIFINQKVAGLLSDVIMDYTPYAMQYVVPVILMPFIILIIVITAMRSISPAIGGEVQILGVSELI